MVDEPRPSPRQDKPFAFRAVVYTIGFLFVILGVVPSLFYIAGERLVPSIDWPGDWPVEIQFYWMSFRSLVGGAVFSAGLAAYLFCSAWLVFLSKAPHVQFHDPQVFVATGPYRWVRNPVVLTLLVTAAGQAIYFASWGIALLVVLGIGFGHWQVTRLEEPNLRRLFGDSYEAYCRRVNRWLPKPPSAKSDE